MWPTYHLAYQAAFAHDLAAGLALLPSSTVILAVSNDPLEPYAQVAADIVAGARIEHTTRQQRADTLRAILAD